jgi:hypothetical protein
VPLLRHATRRPLPRDVDESPSRFGPRPPLVATSCSTLVVSHHLGGLLQLVVPGVLQPGTGRGSPRFSRSTDPHDPKVLRDRRSWSPQRTHPSKNSSLVQQPRPHHCSLNAPLAVTPERAPTETNLGEPATVNRAPRERHTSASSAWWPGLMNGLRCRRVCAFPREPTTRRPPLRPPRRSGAAYLSARRERRVSPIHGFVVSRHTMVTARVAPFAVAV